MLRFCAIYWKYALEKNAKNWKKPKGPNRISRLKDYKGMDGAYRNWAGAWVKLVGWKHLLFLHLWMRSPLFGTFDSRAQYLHVFTMSFRSHFDHFRNLIAPPRWNGGNKGIKYCFIWMSIVTRTEVLISGLKNIISSGTLSSAKSCRLSQKR